MCNNSKVVTENVPPTSAAFSSGALFTPPRQSTLSHCQLRFWREKKVFAFVFVVVFWRETLPPSTRPD
jgi:hypothetical protein